MEDILDYSVLPNWRLIEIATRELSNNRPNGLFTRREIINYINNVLLKDKERRNPDSLNPMIQAVTANVPGGAPGGIGKNILYRVGRGLYRLFNPETDKPIPEKDLGSRPLNIQESAITSSIDEITPSAFAGERRILISRVDHAWRIIIPEGVRKIMNLNVGDYVAFVEEEKRIVLRKARFKIELE